MGNVALITGAAKRLGAATASLFHQQGWNVVIHYQSSAEAAEQLVENFNQQRANSAIALPADMNQQTDIQRLAEQAANQWQRLDVLVNNASQFYPTPIADATENDWQALMNSNLRGPFELIQAVLPHLQQSKCASIVNMIDIYAAASLAEHPIYCSAKAGLAALTRNLAQDLGPTVRVNGVAPGAILWPSSGQDNAGSIIAATPLKRCGTPDEIAQAVYWLAAEASFITGHILPVDGGRSIVMAGN